MPLIMPDNVRRGVQVTQVDNGYIVTCNRCTVDKDSDGHKHETTHQVAESLDGLMAILHGYYGYVKPTGH